VLRAKVIGAASNGPRTDRAFRARHDPACAWRLYHGTADQLGARDRDANAIPCDSNHASQGRDTGKKSGADDRIRL
jgi:hypothetical protein